MTPELVDCLFSPSDTGCSSPFGEHASPTASDVVQTPFIDHSEDNTSGLCRHGNLGSRLFTLGDEDEMQPSLFGSSPPGTPPCHKHKAEYMPFPDICLPHRESPTGFHLDSSFTNKFDNSIGSRYDCSAFSADSLSPPNLDYHHSSKTRRTHDLAIAFNLDATLHSPLFPAGHTLNPHFVRHYRLEDELGSGGYGFVMTARHRTKFHEVAVKFIIKSRVPNHAWVEDEMIGGKLPMEVMLLSFIEHENVVKCLDLFEDSLYFYLIQELHGSPWPKFKRYHYESLSSSTSSASLTPSTPALSPSVSTSSISSSSEGSPTVSQRLLEEHDHKTRSSTTHNTPSVSPGLDPMLLTTRPEFSKRPSYDLFECIEQSEHKRLSETQARYVFSQVVDAIYYLDSQGITHRDIKDENLVINKDLKVKLIDFGSAAVVDPTEPRPYYSIFYGTTAYASPEILLKKKYQAPPAEIWTLGVLLSYLLTGTSPFLTLKDAIKGRITLPDAIVGRLSKATTDLMRRCLDPDPLTRATIAEVKAHAWLV